MLNIVLVGGMAVLGKELIEAGLECDYSMGVIADPSEVESNTPMLSEADVVVGWPLTAGIVRTAHNARLFQAAGAGVDQLPFDLLRPGVTVANTYHHETAIAEYILMAMLMLPRNPSGYDERLRAGNWWDSCIWGQEPNIGVLESRTALLIGVGRIALAVARRAKAFGVRTIGVSRDPSAPLEYIDSRTGYPGLDDALPQADFVIPCCPLTPQTDGLIGAAQFQRMQPSAYLINTARGNVVDEEALYDALRNHSIAGAAIDVWYSYPKDPSEPCLPSRFPFETLDNVLMTPHVSGWTKRTVEGRMRDIAENINRLASGRELINVVHSGSGKPG